MPHKTIVESISAATIGWLISTYWGTSLMSALDVGANTLPSGFNPMKVIDSSMFIPDSVKYLIFGIGIFLWFAMTASMIFRAVAGGVKMWYEGKAKYQSTINSQCTFPDCRYYKFRDEIEKELHSRP